MKNGEYAFLTLDFDIEIRYLNGTWPYVPKEELFATFDGVLDMAVGQPRGKEFDETMVEMEQTLKDKNLPVINQVP